MRETGAPGIMSYTAFSLTFLNSISSRMTLTMREGISSSPYDCARGTRVTVESLLVL
jgi:hypothetical protein